MKNIKFKYQKYPEYKDSGVEWLGDIPKGWELKRLKYLGKMYAGLSDKKGADFSKVFQKDKKPFIPFTNIFKNTIIDESDFQYVKIKSNEKQNIVKKEDILFLMSSETIEDIGKTSLYNGEQKVYLNSFCKGFRIKENLIDAYFINWLLQTKAYRIYFSIVGRGFTRINIKQEYVNNLLAILPPLPEQTAIANFLDDKTAKIDRAVAQKEKLIALLKERKQIIIQNAVTKGLNPNVKLKESGVEWIGEIPEHWEVKRLKYELKSSSEKVFSKSTDLTYIGMENIESKTGIWLKQKTETEGLANKFQIGDILFGKLRPYLSKVYLAEFDGICSTEFIVYRCSNPEYFKFLLISYSFIDFINSSTYGAKMPRANSEWIGNQFIPIPFITEQKQIVEHIETQSAKIDQAISLQQKQIEKLKEYKTVLIDSAVTGKIKVS